MHYGAPALHKANADLEANLMPARGARINLIQQLSELRRAGHRTISGI